MKVSAVLSWMTVTGSLGASMEAFRESRDTLAGIDDMSVTFLIFGSEEVTAAGW
jgi:hypothetical protein